MAQRKEDIAYLIRSAVECIAGIHAMLAVAQERERTPKMGALKQSASRLRQAADYIDRIIAEIEKRKNG